MSLSELEARLGVHIEPALLELALTHRSVTSVTNQNNERLEFLGDSILGFVVADLVFRTYPEFDENNSSRLTNQIVRETSLSKFAKELGLGAHIKSKGLVNPGGEHVDSVLADAFEALIGAIYLSNNKLFTN
jgi:ribonuclease-3